MAVVYTELDPSTKNWAGTGTDEAWGDYDLYTNEGVPKGAVAEIIIANTAAGTENITGIRTDGSGLARYVDIHEAEGGGETHVRMFVTCHATTGLIEVYGEDISDAIFYVVGYWTGVTFTELADTFAANGSGSWGDEILATAACAGKVCHIIARNNEDNVNNTMGVRANGSSLERKFNLHEPETGGANSADFLVQADSNYTIDVYSEDATNANFLNTGYFGTELDFTEKCKNSFHCSITVQLKL
jgi:hypothetical protein